MSLVNIKTDLKSLKYGTDRPEMGSSGQPYIKKGIKGTSHPANKDFLLRGGVNAPLDAAEDVARMAKYFTDLKSPSGLLFIAKQQLLSRTSVATQASTKTGPTGKDWKNASLNAGVYSPINTLLSTGLGWIGTSVSKQVDNLDPFQSPRGYYNNGSYPNVETSDVLRERVIGGSDGAGNRLVKFQKSTSTDPNNSVLYSYSGGPGSQLGIGNTDINFARSNQGAPLKTLSNPTYSSIRSNPFNQGNSVYYPGKQYEGTTPTYNPIKSTGDETISGVSTAYYQSLGYFGDSGLFSLDPNTTTTQNIFKGLTFNDGTLITNIRSVYNSEFKLDDQGRINSSRIKDNNTFTWNQFQIEDNYGKPGIKSISTETTPPNIRDFRKPLLDGVKDEKSSIMGISLDYTDPNRRIDGDGGSRVNMQNPSQQGNVYNYSKGKILNKSTVSVVDKINFLPIYKSTTNKQSSDVNDLVKFRIAAILRDGKKVYTHFRAYINSFSDDYTSNWSSLKYMGRGEEFHKYDGFTRGVDVSFTVAAQSKPELMAQYKKLNFLASTLAPDYGGKKGSGYMGGVLHELTLGGWCYNLPGFMSKLSLSVPQESPWEIAVGVDTEKGKGDKTVKEMPHIVNVQMSFTPIHNFRPELQDNTFNEIGEVTEYGEQRFISLDNGFNNNYVPVSLKQGETIDSKQSNK